MNRDTYELLKHLEQGPSHFRAVQRQLQLNATKTSSLLKGLREQGLALQSETRVGKGGALPYQITPNGRQAAQDYEFLERRREALTALRRKFDEQGTPNIMKEADGMRVLFSSFMTDLTAVLVKACEMHSCAEAERYVELEAVGGLIRGVIDLTRVCYARRDLEIQDVPILGYVHDAFEFDLDEELAEWIRRHTPEWATPYKGKVLDKDLLDILMTAPSQAAIEKLGKLAEAYDKQLAKP